MSQMNPYMTNPNAELYAMLGQRAANLDRQGPSISAGSGIEFDLMDRQAALAELAAVRSEDRAGRARALDAIARRDAMSTQEDFMMRMIERQKNLLMEEQDLHLQLASAELPMQEELLAKLQKKQADILDFNTRKVAAEAELARRSPEFAKEYSQRIGQVRTLADGLSRFKDVIDKGLGAEKTIENYLANPNKAGLRPESGAGAALMGLSSVAESVTDFFNFTSNAVSNASLERLPRLLGAGGRDMVAAALNSTGIVDALKQSGFDIKSLNYDPVSRLDFQGANPFEVGSAAQRLGADRFTNNLLSELAVNGLVNSGVNVNVDQAQQAMSRLVGELNDISRSSVPLKPQDISTRLMPILEDTAKKIFGEAEGQNSVPKLVELMDATFSAATKESGKYAGSILVDGQINQKSIQNAAVGTALQRAGALGHIMKAGTKNQVLTAENLNRVIGLTEQKALIDPETGEVNYAMLNLDPTTEAGTLVRQALGGKTTAEVEDFLKFLRSNKQTMADITKQQGVSELETMAELLRTQLEGKRQTLEAKRGILQQARKPKK